MMNFHFESKSVARKIELKLKLAKIGYLTNTSKFLMYYGSLYYFKTVVSRSTGD